MLLSSYGSSGTSTGLAGDQSIYSDLLHLSIFNNITWDSFEDSTFIGSTTMDHDSTDEEYDFTAAEVLTSSDLVDPLLSPFTVTMAMMTVHYSDSGSPTLQMTADGGSHWETVSNNVIHYFSNTGTDLRLRFTGGGTGSVESWAVLYNPNTGAGVNIQEVEAYIEQWLEENFLL